MILRKPYAFIIKHFRLIHLIILGCLGFILKLAIDIRDVFQSMQSSNTYIYAGASSLINKHIYTFILVILFLSCVLFWLLKEKKKPTKLYLFLIFYCFIVFFSFYYEFGLLETITEEIVKSEVIILGKDIGFLITLPTYVFMFICFIRGIGFNLKQFNFSKDVEELQIVDKDSAEFEVLIGQNNYKYLRFIRRTIREIKYYILENKFVISIVSSIIGVILVGVGIVYYNEYLKALKEEESSIVNNIAYTVRDSYITAHDYNGNVVDDDYKFVVVDMTFYNSGKEDQALDPAIITLATGDLYYFPSFSFFEKFYDLGYPYMENEEIPAGESLDRSLIFKIPKSVSTKNFVLRVEYKVEQKGYDLVSKYKQFDVKAKSIDNDNATIPKSLNETINTNVVERNSYSLTILSAKFADSYENKYMLCRSIQLCNPLSKVIKPDHLTTDTLIVINYSSQESDDPQFIKKFNTSEKIFDAYMEVKYKIYNVEYVTDANVIHNTGIADKIFVYIDRNILDAQEVSLLFHFRDETYEVFVKSTESTETTTEEKTE